VYKNYKSIVPLLICLFALSLHGAEPAIVRLPADSSQTMIQAALDRLSGGGEVVLAPGTYEVRRPIMLRHDRQTLRGGGLNTILHLADHADCPVVILGSPLTAPGRATTHLRLADLLISGNRLNQQVEFWRPATDGSQLSNSGIDVWEVSDSTVEDVVCRDCRSGGLVTALTKRLDVRDFTACDNQFDGLACYLTEESHFSRLHLHDNLAAGISLDLSFKHNVIDGAVLSGNNLGIFMRDSRDNSFQDLTISKSRSHGIFMAQTASPVAGVWRLCPGTECTGNHFQGLVITNCGGDAFLVNNLSCKNNKVRDAHFLNNKKGNLTLAGEALVGIAGMVTSN